ncbi:MAG: hypothetical protein WC001_08970 [Desulfurivibrionaceae bacterium]
MYEHHPSIVTPPDDTVIWRYMNLERVLALLGSQRLFLCRLDGFSDPWEGVWPKPFVEAIRKNWPQADGDQFLTFSKRMRCSFFVNCWHESKYESAALWDQYVQSAGFALRTTVGHLKQSIIDERHIYLGRIRYLDYDSETVPEVNMLLPPFLKRKSFQHENEVRVMHWDMPIRENDPIAWDRASQSHSLKIDLSVLIQELFLSPTTDDWLIPQIEKLLSIYGLPHIVPKKSGLYAPHVY